MFIVYLRNITKIKKGWPQFKINIKDIRILANNFFKLSFPSSLNIFGQDSLPD